MRQVFKRSKLHKAALYANRVEFEDGFYKNGKPKTAVWYRCDKCKQHFKHGQVDVDHIEEIGVFDGNWTKLVQRMWCLNYENPFYNLQVLCKGCQKEKTQTFNKKMRLKRKHDKEQELSVL